MTKKEDGSHRIAPNYLHIWPRGQFMMIALPNLDGSFTCTLFMPFAIFDTIKTSEEGLDFMQREFPDSVPIFGEEALKAQFGPGTLPGLPMVSIKTSPHRMQNSLIVGDAAHAIVPFYGQGMNAGMEDIAVLLDLYREHGIKKAMEIYGESRPKDAHAIADLAMYNYIEMRDLVRSPWFLFRGKVDRLLTSIMPRFVIPLYEMVVFNPQIGYSTALTRSKKQGKVIDAALFSSVGLVGLLAFLRPKILTENFETLSNYFTKKAETFLNL